MGNSKVRVRYAPSPTGFLHIGGARSALFNYLFAKKYDGQIIFRVEDTDVERNVVGGEESQYNDLRWLGIDPDESPVEPNPKYAPYRQMERLDIYKKYADQLVAEGKAYYCYCTNEELEIRKEQQLNAGIKAAKYDRKCLNLSQEQIEAYKKEGRKPCIRIRLKDHEKLEFDALGYCEKLCAIIEELRNAEYSARLRKVAADNSELRKQLETEIGYFQAHLEELRAENRKHMYVVG